MQSEEEAFETLVIQNKVSPESKCIRIIACNIVDLFVISF